MAWKDPLGITDDIGNIGMEVGLDRSGVDQNVISKGGGKEEDKA